MRASNTRSTPPLASPRHATRGHGGRLQNQTRSCFSSSSSSQVTACTHRAATEAEATLSSAGMPPLDLGSLLLRDGGTSESEAAGSDADVEGWREDPYAPAQSLRLRIGADIDWADVGAAAAVLERDDSTKDAGANPKSAARRSVHRASMSTSAAATPRAVAVVIGGLPAAGGKAAAREHGRRARRDSPRRLGGRARVFAAGGEAAAADRQADPGSPKVSCLGGVRSRPRAEAEAAVGGGRRWWAWLVTGVACCGSSRRSRAREGGEGEW